ncbi:MAG: hypothetical protein HFH48_04685 [Lachnospiraceae bacterium]|nr:hypothetical protein [Lachnospiraceae bacterium]
MLPKWMAKAAVAGEGNYPATVERSLAIQEAKKSVRVINCKKNLYVHKKI